MLPIIYGNLFWFDINCWGIGIVTSFTLSIVMGQFSNLIFYLIKANSIYYDKNEVATLDFTASRKAKLSYQLSPTTCIIHIFKVTIENTHIERQEC